MRPRPAYVTRGADVTRTNASTNARQNANLRCEQDVFPRHNITNDSRLDLLMCRRAFL